MKALFKLTPAEDAEIIKLFPDLSNRKIAQLLKLDEKAVISAGKRLHLRKTKACKAAQPNATVWTAEMINFLKSNFHSLTNAQLAEALNVRLTVLRNKTRELGLQHIDMQYWSPEEHQYLVAHYKTCGDVEIAEALQRLFPRVKKWTKKHITKRRAQQGLRRSAGEQEFIKQKNTQADGRLFKSDLYVANFISRDPEIKSAILKHPEIVDLKRNQLILSRTLKEVQHGQ